VSVEEIIKREVAEVINELINRRVKCAWCHEDGAAEERAAVVKYLEDRPVLADEIKHGKHRHT